jgi:hypothetical protein
MNEFAIRVVPHAPSDKIDYNLKPNLNTDKEIESELYGMRGRHALSPFKAYFF